MASPATDRSFRLGEGPVWDERRERLLWVDILAGEILTGVLEDDRVRITGSTALSGLVGAVALTEREDRLLVAAHDRLVLLDVDGGYDDDDDGGARRSTAALIDGTSHRFNDGQVDRSGGFVIGTLSLAGPSTAEQLFRIGDAGTEVLDTDLTLSNGLAWSVDGTRFYSVDTMTRTIRLREDDGGSVGPWAPFAVLDAGYPDGICIDADDHLWVAVWGEGAVLRFAPDGRVVDRIDVDAPHTSSVTFAGPGLDVLVITTAGDELSVQQRRDHPRSGCLFTARPQARGVPARRVAESVIDRLFPTVT